jgi:hypothetical protein
VQCVCLDGYQQGQPLNVKTGPEAEDMITNAWITYNDFYDKTQNAKPTFFDGYHWRTWMHGGDYDVFMPALITADAKRVLDGALAPLVAYVEANADESRTDMEGTMASAMTQLVEFESRLNSCDGQHKEKAASERS